MLAALRTHIRRAGLSFRQVEQRLGQRHDYLRQVLSGAIELRYEHVAGVLAALDVAPVEFFEEVYGPPDLRGRPTAEPPHPAYPLSARLVRHASLRVLIWRLKEKGIFSEEEVEHIFAELDREKPLIPPRY
ncbi:MAG TPA: hypothetical protein VF121_19260 [Thermoanaerobaculia bacterium]|nr:hypothetical protein [Thermoanaerobaculia bacterium]